MMARKGIFKQLVWAYLYKINNEMEGNLKEDIRNALRNAIDQELNKSLLRPSKVCKVIAISADTVEGLMICDCQPLDGGAIIEDVKLCAEFTDSSVGTGFLLIPKLNSNVIVSFKADADAFVSMVSEVDFIYLNGNDKGGLININDLITQYNAKLTALKTAISASLAIIDTQLLALSQAGGSAAAFNTAAALITGLNKITLENKTIQHGGGTLV